MPVFNLESLKALSQSPPLAVERVPIPELGADTVAWIAELTANEKEARIERPWLDYKEATGQKDDTGFRAHVAAACWCHSAARDFVATTPEEIRTAAALLGNQGRPTSRMFAVADRLNAVGGSEVGAIEKN